MKKPGHESKLHIWGNSLVGQLLIRFWVCHVIFFSLIGSVQYNALKTSLYLNVEQNLAADYESIRSSMLSWLASNELPPGRLADLRPGNFVAFYTQNYQLKSVVYSYGRNNEMPPFIEKELDFDLKQKAFSNQPFVLTPAKNEKYMLIVKPVLATQVYYLPLPVSEADWEDYLVALESGSTGTPVIGYALIGEPLNQADVILERNRRGYIVNALIILLFSTLLTAMALQKPLDPLLKISSTARKIAAGQYNLRLPYMPSTSEIDQLRETLNHMLGQMEHALNTERTAKERMSRFMADASHELRTPLTSIRGFLEILQCNHNTDKDTLDYAHKTMLLETERLIRLTEGLLTLNRIAQDDGEDEQAAQTSLQNVLEELVSLITPLLEERTLFVNDTNLNDIIQSPLLQHDPTLPLKSDELKQILYNLINNAIQHTGPTGVIEIIAEKTGNKNILSIKDNGKGIPPEDLPYIFERFYRSDRSRTHYNETGAGLGLAIVSEIVKVRGGQITVSSEVGAGTTFTISFPIYNERTN